MFVLFLSVLFNDALYSSDQQKDDWWLVNWKGFERKRPTIQGFVWTNDGKPCQICKESASQGRDILLKFVFIIIIITIFNTTKLYGQLLLPYSLRCADSAFGVMSAESAHTCLSLKIKELNIGRTQTSEVWLRSAASFTTSYKTAGVQRPTTARSSMLYHFLSHRIDLWPVT